MRWITVAVVVAAATACGTERYVVRPDEDSGGTDATGTSNTAGENEGSSGNEETSAAETGEQTDGPDAGTMANTTDTEGATEGEESAGTEGSGTSS